MFAHRFGSLTKAGLAVSIRRQGQAAASVTPVQMLPAVIIESQAFGYVEPFLVFPTVDLAENIGLYRRRLR